MRYKWAIERVSERELVVNGALLWGWLLFVCALGEWKSKDGSRESAVGSLKSGESETKPRRACECSREGKLKD